MAAADTLRAPRGGDIAIAAVTAAAAISALLLIRELLSDLPGKQPMTPAIGTVSWWLVVVVILGQCILLPWARQAPRAVVLSVSVAAFLLALTMPGAVFDVTTFAVPVAVFLGFGRGPSRSLWVVMAGAAVLVATASIVNGIGGEGDEPLFAVGEAAVQSGGLFAAPLLLAAMLRARRDSLDAHGRELRALSRERDALVDATIARERTAMARELHDIAAHHLSGIALMASVVERQVDREPDAAREAAKQIRSESTAVLQNLRRVVGLLRDDGAVERSVENFASVPDLIDGVVVGGTAEVRLSMLPPEPSGSFGAGIGPLAQLAAYRTIQESLANAAMHAPGATCLVELDDTADDHVAVVVRNSPPAAPIGVQSAGDSGGGFGLVGMRERADLIGAELQYGHTPDGGWDVRLTIPRDAVATGRGAGTEQSGAMPS